MKLIYGMTLERRKNMKFKPHEYQKYCISRCITDDKLGLFLDMGLRKDNYNTNSNK